MRARALIVAARSRVISKPWMRPVVSSSVYEQVVELRSWIADLLGVAAVVAGVIMFFFARRELRRQKAAVDATRAAVENAILDLQGRYLASVLSEARWSAAEFADACRDERWPLARFSGDRLRWFLLRLANTAGFVDADVKLVRDAADNVAVVLEKVRAKTPRLSSLNLKSLEGIRATIEELHSVRAVPALAKGQP